MLSTGCLREIKLFYTCQIISNVLKHPEYIRFDAAEQVISFFVFHTAFQPLLGYLMWKSVIH